MKKVTLVLILIISFFILMVDAPASPKFDLTKYHNYDEMTKALKDFQSSYSNLVKLISAGKSSG